HVRVQRRDARMVTQHHRIAVAALAADEIDDSVRRGADTRAGRRTVVHALVLAPLFEDRMKAPREPGGHAREFERGTQEGFAQTLAVGGVIRAASVLVLIPGGAEAAPVID